ncbi:efflux RND transporter periplasmic adaptor subunit [Marinobacter salinexigens]|uniref:Efflux RND transporter periplasmic adaptor subunit n=1 Tax=Marinobacter salinexigens TaxID=2919747 RepID=A0A5B0VDM7_9GAMM|nr:efflux RND transporter periplasmic adaptor subunit [Marinobacter salinexigens]KAA1172780.1 efflux RND transporter periplasmic adaptor subunit [Marinobacter salinexigens]
MRHSTQSVLLLLITSFLLSACGEQQASAQAAATPPPTHVGYVVVEEKPFTLVNELPGRTTPYQIAEVRPQITGLIKERLFDEGETVEAGQALYQIDDKLYRAALASARADLANAKANRESAELTANRYEKLIKTGAVSQQELDQARATFNASSAQVAAAEAALDTARINLDYTRIEAPISGRISRSSVTAGALVTANQSSALVTIRQLDPIYVDLTQSYGELQQLRDALASGQLETLGDDKAPVRLVRENNSDYPHEGTLQFSEYAVDETTGSVTLRALFPNPEQALLPGMFVRAQLPQAERSNAVLVPQKAVSREPNGQAVAMVIGEGNTVEKRQVETEKAIGNQWLIRSGLDAGDRLIVDGLQKIRPGALVTPVDIASETANTNTQDTDSRG